MEWIQASVETEVAVERTRARARRGQLYAAHAPRAGKLAYLLTADPDLAQDLAHEAFARLITRIGLIRNADAVEAYLRRTVINLARKHWRRLGRSAPTSVERVRTSLDERSRIPTWASETPCGVRSTACHTGNEPSWSSDSSRTYPSVRRRARSVAPLGPSNLWPPAASTDYERRCQVRTMIDERLRELFREKAGGFVMDPAMPSAVVRRARRRVATALVWAASVVTAAVLVSVLGVGTIGRSPREMTAEQPRSVWWPMSAWTSPPSVRGEPPVTRIQRACGDSPSACGKRGSAFPIRRVPSGDGRFR